LIHKRHGCVCAACVRVVNHVVDLGFLRVILRVDEPPRHHNTRVLLVDSGFNEIRRILLQ